MNYKLKDTFLEDGFYVTQNYMNNPTYYAQFNLLGHEGVDFGNSNKQIMVRSPLSGTVFVSVDKNYGNLCVVEDYKQQCAVYICHMTGVKVVTGQEVKSGQQLGEMDATGNSNGEHVHLNFVILKDGLNKYRLKKYNWGFLDPQYPRDTGSTIKFEGVEDYTIQWGEGEITSDPNLQQRITDLEKEVSEKNAQIKSYDEQVQGWSKKYDECNAQRIEAGASADGFRKQFNELVAKLASILGTRQETVEIIASVETAITYEDKAEKLDRQIALQAKEYQSTIDSLEKELSTLKSTTEAKIIQLEGTIKELKYSSNTPIQPVNKLSIIDIIKKILGVK